jgi:GABA(A) receptor-associated protein
MEEVIRRHPNRVPVKIDENSDFDIERRKYLIPRDMTLGNFVSYLRKHIKINKHEAMFVLIDGILPPVSATFESLYITHVNEDRLLHIILKRENTFG